MNPRLVQIARWVTVPVLATLLWWALTSRGTNFFVPQPGTLFSRLWDVWLTERLTSDVLPSLGRLAVGLLASVVLGILLGAAIGSIPWLRWLLEPVLEFMRAVPSTILIPVLLLLIGINDTMKVTVIVLGCIWPILLNTIEGVRSIDEVLRHTASVYRIKGLSRLFLVTLPGASPQIIAGIRQSLAVGLILMVTSEMFAATDGIGYAIINFQNRIAIPEMWAGIVLLGIIGVALSLIFQFLEKRILAWYHGLKEASNDS